MKSPEQIAQYIICGWLTGVEGIAPEAWEELKSAIAAALQSERAEVERLQAERDHWKTNHDNQVAIKAALMDRPDLRDRAGRVVGLLKEVERLQAELDEAALQVQRLLASATPHPEQHPTMYAAWASAEEWLSRHTARKGEENL